MRLDVSALPLWAVALIVLAQIIMLIPHIAKAFGIIAALLKNDQNSQTRIIVHEAKRASSPKRKPVRWPTFCVMWLVLVESIYFAYLIATSEYPDEDRTLTVGMFVFLALFMVVVILAGLHNNRSLRW